MRITSYVLLNGVFFFKQKTAYEMRISDWSSDVCSSDLLPQDASFTAQRQQATYCSATAAPKPISYASGACSPATWCTSTIMPSSPSVIITAITSRTRSEEHTSELQSLMRISYAVFCLTKKKNRQHYIIHPHNTYEHIKNTR